MHPMVLLRRLVLLAGLLAAAPQSPQPPRTGMIAGQVVDASGAPVAEAIVRVTLTGMALTRDAAPPPGGRVMADGEGRFFVADLPAGDYYLEATKEGYARGTFAIEPGEPIDKRRFAAAGRPGDPHDLGATGLRIERAHRLGRARFVVLDDRH